MIRLLRRDACRYTERRVHEEIDRSGKRIGKLRGKLLHYTYWTFEQYFEKFGRYTTWAAEDLYEAGKKAGVFKLLLRPPLKFFQLFILRLGFLDGLPGLILSMLAGMSVFVKLAKLWALHHARSQPDPETAQKEELG